MQINKEKFESVVNEAKAKAANDPKWTRAIEKAAAGILDGSLIVTICGDKALVTSANGQYWVNGHCECAAAKHGNATCYHRAAKRLIEKYEETPAPASRAELIAEIKTTFAAKFPAHSLTETVNRLCGPYTLEMLGVANLRHVLAAIA